MALSLLALTFMAVYFNPLTLLVRPVAAAFTCQAGYTTQTNNGQTYCQICPAGSACPNPTVTTTNACASPNWAPMGSTACTQVLDTSGKKFMTASTIPQMCGAGTFSTGTGCSTPTAQDVCPSPLSSAKTTCGATQVVFDNSGGGHARTTCTKCKLGMQCISTPSESACTTAGTYSTAGSCTNALAGTISPSFTMNSQCPSGTISGATISATGAVTNALYCVLCPLNKACALPSTTTPTTCNFGEVGQTSCQSLPTNFSKYVVTISGGTSGNISKELCQDGKYISGTTCANCPAGQQCQNFATGVTCPTTEEYYISDTTTSQGTFASSAFYSVLGKGTCQHVPYNKKWTGTALVDCAAGEIFEPRTATCTSCGSNCPVNQFFPTMTCQWGQYLQTKNQGQINQTQKCVACLEGSICGPSLPSTTSNPNMHGISGLATNFNGDATQITKSVSRGQASWGGEVTEGGAAKVVPYAACFEYSSTKQSSQSKCTTSGTSNIEWAVKGQLNTSRSGCGSSDFMQACDMDNTSYSCPSSATKNTYRSSPNFVCQMSSANAERNNANSQQGCNTGSPSVNSKYSWYGRGCTNCVTRATVGTIDGMSVVGNYCGVHFELNDIPCDPGKQKDSGGCGFESDPNAAGTYELQDGKEVVFGCDRYCMSVKAPVDGNTITTGSTQTHFHGTYGVKTTTGNDLLPERQCQDCPEMMVCHNDATAFCWGHELPMSCYKGVGTVPDKYFRWITGTDHPNKGAACPKNLHLDDRRIQRNDGQFCQDANTRYHSHRIITFAAHYFLDHNNDAKQYLNCPFQTKQRTVSRHIFWEDDCASPNGTGMAAGTAGCWSITDGQQNQLGVDGERSRPKGSTQTTTASNTYLDVPNKQVNSGFPLSNKDGEQPKRNRKGYFKNEVDTSGDYYSKVWFLDDETEIYPGTDAQGAAYSDKAYEKYPYPYCKINTNFFDFTVIDSHKKTTYQKTDFTRRSPSQQVSYACSIYDYFTPNYPMCFPNMPGFIGSVKDTPTETMVGEAQPGINQYYSKLEDKGVFTGSTLMNCPHFMRLLGQGGANPHEACRIGEQGNCLDPASDYCHTGQDFKCPNGMYRASGSPQNTINNCAPISAGVGVVCPPGYNCPQYTTDPTMMPAQPGQESTSTTTFANCPTGKYCPAATASGNEKTCPAGFTGPSDVGHFSSGACEPNAAGTKTGGGACSAGFYCPQGSDVGIQCPPSSYASSTGKQQISDCTACSSGKLCGLGASSEGSCPVGHFCYSPTFFKYEYTCPVGKTVSSGTPSAEADCSTNCAAGSFCREGADAPVTNLCGAASYVCATGSARSTCPAGQHTTDGISCSACSAGNYCVGNGPMAGCKPGYYQPNGGQSACVVTTGGGYTTIDGQSILQNAPDGQWSLTTGDSQATKCEYGYTCKTQVKTICQNGLKCPLQTADGVALTAGSDFSVTGLWYEKKCKPGYYCTATPGTGPTQVTQGFYSAAGASTAPTTKCNDGYNCPVGSIGSKMQPCPANTWFTSSTTCPSTTMCCIDTQCPAGNYCIQGQSLACPKGFTCPARPDATSYTADVTSRLKGQLFDACDKGTYLDTLGSASTNTLTYQSTATLGSCLTCTAGNACVETGAHAVYTNAKCGAGYYCAAGSPTTTPLIYCNTGISYQDPTPTASYDAATLTCTNIFFERATSSTQTTRIQKYGVCPSGYYCEKGTTAPQVCPAGTFSSAYGNRAVTDCIRCLEGYFCAGGTNPATRCRAGTSCPSPAIPNDPSTAHLGSTAETKFQDAGMFSGERYPASIKCEPGSFMASITDASTYQSTCTIASNGQYQHLFGQGAAETTLCTQGFNCKKKSPDDDLGIVYPKQCNYGEQSDLSDFGNCVSCRAFSYCWKNKQLSTDADTYLCPNGYVCKSGANHQKMNIDKDATGQAFFTDNDANTSNTINNFLCPKGNFCDNTALKAAVTAYPPADVDATYFTKCADGSYRSAIGGTTQADSCYACPYGYVCNTVSFANSNITPAACPANNYCPQGTGSVSVLSTGCTAGHFCSAKAGAEYLCPWGKFQDLTLQASCKACTNGSMCNAQGLQAVVACTQNHYCTQDGSGYGAAISYLCPEGQLVGSFDASGVLSTNSGSAKTQCANVDTYHWFRSPGNDNAATPAPLYGWITDGYVWQPNTGAKDAIPDTATVCESGFFCQKGVPQPCSDGTWCNNRKRTQDGVQCPAGYYCQINNNTVKTPNVLTGTTFKALIRQFCPQGYYCEIGTKVTTSCNSGTPDAKCPKKCPIGTYSSAFGLQSSTDCHKCPEGFVCATEGMTWAVVTQQLTVPTNEAVQNHKCPANYYCLEGTNTQSSFDVPNAPQSCTIGTYCPEGSIERVVCEPGTYTSAAQQSSCSPCERGFYCPWMPEVLITPASQKTQCPIGHMCSATSMSQPEPCPPGQYQDQLGQQACLPCPVTKYCPKYGMTAGIACPDTMKCPASSIQPIQCQDGEYCDSSDTSPPATHTQSGSATGVLDPVNNVQIPASSCPGGHFCKMGRKIKCYPGYVCSINSKTPTPLNGVGGYICPKGYYCLEGTLHSGQTPCPIGTYQPSFGAEALSDCKNCLAGYECNTLAATFQVLKTCASGYICDSTGTATICAVGMYCPAGAVEMIPCEDGYYQDLTGQTQCKKCPAGKFCKKVTSTTPITGSITPQICPIGYYCPEGTPYDFSFPCPVGSYGDKTGLVNSYPVKNPDGSILYEGCQPCVATFYCPRPGMNHIASDPNDYINFKCKKGYLCAAGSKKEIGSELCPKPFYCIDGIQHSCPAGQFIPVRGADSANECVDCPPGKICPPGGSIVDCPAGYFCSSGRYYSEVIDDPNGPKRTGTPNDYCPTGHYCPAGSFQPRKCLPGYYQPLTGQSTCLKCPLGFFCQNPGTDDTTKKPCDATSVNPQGGTFDNWYCPEGSVYPKLCKIGQTFDTTTKLCIPCPANKYCWPEPSTWSADLGVRGNCDFASGFVCRGGAYSPKPQIKNLKLILAGSSQFNTYNGPIIPGYYSDTTGAAFACNPGQFQPSAYSMSCMQCMKGRYCSKTAMFDLTEFRCKGGYECAKGQTQADPPAMKCPAGYQCPSKVPTKLICEDGYYSVKSGLVVCEPCLSGNFCQNDNNSPLTTMQSCILGSICNGGEPRQPNCPDGFLKAEKMCLNCTATNYCRGGQIAGKCAAGFVCNGTFANSDPNPSGYECPVGQYCGIGVSYSMPCPFKTMSIADKQRQASDCRGCQPGYICEWGKRNYRPCPAGSWCPPVGDMIIYKQYEYLCPAGTYNPDTLKVYQADCLQCEEGYYCEYEGMVNTGKICPKGHFCPLGSSLPRKCRAGTYFDQLGAVFEDDCLDCPIGFFCPEGAAEPIECEPGQLCDMNTAIPRLCPGGYFCNNETQFLPEPCQPNYYCPLGSGLMIKCGQQYTCDWYTEFQRLCGPGYYVVDHGIPIIANECLPCPKGEFSNMDVPGCRKCTPGYVCYGRTNTPYPTIFSQHNGEVCPKGHYCPLGTSSALPCPPGTYNPKEGAESDSQCLVCQVNTFNDQWGSVGCKPCGQFATSKEEAEICTCVGAGRQYSKADASCRCKSGFDFKNVQGVSEAEMSSTQDCFPIVLDRCTNYGNGTDFVRSPSGECRRYDDCADSCQGEPGIRSSVTGICTCSNKKSVDSVCNQACRDSAPKVEYINSYQVQLTYQNGTVEIVNLNDAGDSFGTITCPFPPCSAVSVEIGKQGFGGTYEPPKIVQNALASGKKRRQRLLQSQIMGSRFQAEDWPQNKTATINVHIEKSALNETIFNDTIEFRDIVEYERRRLQQVLNLSVKNPVYCLKQNQSMMMAIPDPYHYPVYLKDSVLNSNINFDYGQFLILKQNMERKAANGDMSPSIFSFTFTEAGSYVFTDASDPNSLMIVSVKGKGETCSDSDRYIQEASASNVAEQGVKIKNNIIQRPNYMLYGFIIAILVICTAIALSMIGYCLRSRWSLEDIRIHTYREKQYQISINHGNSEFFDNENDFVNHKSDLIVDEEDDLDNFNLDIQEEIMESGRRYLRYYGKKKQHIKDFNLNRRDKLNELIKLVNNDVQEVQRLAEEKKLRYLDMNKLNEMNDDKLKEDIQKEFEAQNEMQRIEDEQYAKKKDEMMAEASKRDVEKYQAMIGAMKQQEYQANKELNSISPNADLDEDAIRERKELAIHDNGDINSKANQLVFEIENNPNLSNEEKEALLRAHEEAMLELKIAMDADRKKHEKEMDKALQDKLARRKRLREEQYKKQIKEAQREAEKEIDKDIARERTDRFEEIANELDAKKAELHDLPADMQKARNQADEKEADQQRREIDKDLAEKRSKLIDERNQQIAQKFLQGAEDDDELKQEIKNLLAQHGSNAIGQQILEQAEQQKQSEENKLKEKLRLRKEMLEKDRAKNLQKIEQELEEQDIFQIAQLEQAMDEAYFKRKVKEAIVKKFSKKQTDPNTTEDSVNDISADKLQNTSVITDVNKPEDKQFEEAELDRKMEAKQRIFEITKNLDTALEQKSLLNQLSQTDQQLAREIEEQQNIAEAKLANRRELLKARRRNKQVQAVEEQRLKDKIDLMNFEQAEKKKVSEEYIRQLFKRSANDQIETPEQKTKRLELLNEFLSDQFLERLSGLLTKQFLEKDQTLKNLMQKYIDQRLAEVSSIQANFKVDMEALDQIQGYDPVQLAKVKKNLEFNEKALINEVELRLKNAQKEEEASILKVIENRQTKEQIQFREQMANEHAQLRQQLIGDAEIVNKEGHYDQQALLKFERLKNEENKRRLEKIELEKKKLNAEFEADLNEKYKDYEDMVKKREVRKAELQSETMSMRERIAQNKDALKKKAAQFEGIDTNEIMRHHQRNTDAIESVVALEKREQYFKMKQKLEMRKKQVQRAKKAREEAEMNNQIAAGVFGRFNKGLLKKQGTINLDNIEDDSELFKRLKAWKLRKQEYKQQLAENMTADMEKDQIKAMVVKLLTIEEQLKELKRERKNAHLANTGDHKRHTSFINGLMSAQGRRESRWDDTRSASGTVYETMSRVGSSNKRKSIKRESEDQIKRGDSSTSHRNKAMRMSIRSSMDGRSQK